MRTLIETQDHLARKTTKGYCDGFVPYCLRLFSTRIEGGFAPYPVASVAIDETCFVARLATVLPFLPAALAGIFAAALAAFALTGIFTGGVSGRTVLVAVCSLAILMRSARL